MATNEKPNVEIPPDQQPSYELELDDLTVGEGDQAISGRKVEVHCVGVSWVTGHQFDSSGDRGDTFEFGLNQGQVIPAGIRGLRE